MPNLRYVRVAAASLNQTPLDWEGNKRRILESIQAAQAKQVSLLCLPELCISGYACEDMFHAVYVHEMSAKILFEIIPATQNITVAISLPVSFRGGVYNAAAVVSNGVLLGCAVKQHLPGDGVHYEPRWFKPWPQGERAEIALFGQRFPFGDLVFDVGHLRFGFEICQDAWVADRTGISLAQRGVDLLLNPSASHFAFGKFAVRKRLVQEAARAFGVGYLYCNSLGNGAGRIVYDGETLIYAGSEWLAQGPRFSFKEWQMSVADIDIATLQMQRAREHAHNPPNQAHLALEVHADFQYPEIQTPIRGNTPPEWEQSSALKAQEFTRVVALGLFDYLIKTKTKGYVVSTSGGADSAATAYMVYAMVNIGVSELGFESFKSRLAHIPEIKNATDIPSLMKALLFCIYQKTQNNTKETADAAKAVSEAMHAEYASWEIDHIVSDYVDGIGKVLKHNFSWQTDDVSLQNIQARVRGPGAWLIANLRGAILLATSNRSEAAVGYTTMDGDTCGGLSPIAGIDKAYLREWLQWCEREGVQEVGPMPALEAVNRLQPSAELKPGTQQRDELEVMPYTMLDAIERRAIRDKQSPIEVWKGLQNEYPEESSKRLGAYVVCFFSLWAKTQWKRERYAPCFHVDDENLDPKTWCRFPLISGAFEYELSLLKAEIAKI